MGSAVALKRKALRTAPMTLLPAGHDGPAANRTALSAGRCACRSGRCRAGRSRLTLYAEQGPVVAVAFHPVRAIGIAGELIAAALPKLDAT